MNSGVSNCIEVRKFWEYLTDLRTNISVRDWIFFWKILSISFRIRIVSNRTISISVEVYEYRRYLVTTIVKCLEVRESKVLQMFKQLLRQQTAENLTPAVFTPR